MFIILSKLLAPLHTMFLLIFLLVWGLLSGLAASATSTDINANFFYLTLNPNATITKFQSVQVVPPASRAPVIPGNVQAIWPALQNNQGIIQTAVANQGRIGEWYYIGLEFCCTPEDWQADKAQQVYPGDRITTQYELTSAHSGVYNVTWNVERGQAGIKAGEMNFSAGSVFNPQEHPTPAGQGPFNKALFAIETQRGSIWDFGPVQWEQITIQADTTRSDWCFRPTNNTNFEHYLDTPAISISGSQAICKYSSLILGDTIPPTPPSSLVTTSHIDPGLITQARIFSPTTSPTAVVNVYRWESPLPTPKLAGPGDQPTSTLSNGLPYPSYSVLSASWESADNSYNSYSSVKMSEYTIAVEASLRSVYGTITITTVDGDSVLTTVTTDNYNAVSSASIATMHGNMETGTGNATSENGGDNDDREPTQMSPLTIAWMVAMLVVICVLVIGTGIWIIQGH
ncbi:hypothetical protein OCU04_007496 [Sclerotinia nivalis]|uniref:Uncharacterized protein n=1 Tax=Sclerotinia nivalis TaxID=352851 RepID=A0A9X0AMD2_9HELO|nr:hypothetical protein OCU04_007496 [Sclerotinia nivalis]